MFERGKQDSTSDGVASLIDEHMRIAGSVVSSGDIILAGGVEGEIKCRNLFVEDNATLTGHITADEAVIAGNVSGEVKTAVLRIKSSGHFDGVIRAAGVEVEDGAVVMAKFRKGRK